MKDELIHILAYSDDDFKALCGLPISISGKHTSQVLNRDMKWSRGAPTCKDCKQLHAEEDKQK